MQPPPALYPLPTPTRATRQRPARRFARSRLSFKEQNGSRAGAGQWGATCVLRETAAPTNGRRAGLPSPHQQCGSSHPPALSPPRSPARKRIWPAAARAMAPPPHHPHAARSLIASYILAVSPPASHPRPAGASPPRPEQPPPPPTGPAQPSPGPTRSRAEQSRARSREQSVSQS